MVVGVCFFELLVHGATSVKDKRRVVKGTVDRLRARFNVSAAEVGRLESWDVAEVAVVCVSNEKAHAEGLLQRVLTWLEESRLDAELGEVALRVEEW